MSPAIVLNKLTKKYGSFEAVKDLDLTISEGTTMGLIGSNGAGKTTTIAMIMGLITPTSGQVNVLGQDMRRAPRAVLKRINFQSPYLGMPAQLTVWQNLNVFGRLYNVANVKRRIEELIVDFDLREVMHRQTGKLSAGQKTRVSLAKALLNNPEVLLLDEPTASLDPERAEWVRKHLLTYQKNHKATILLSSHNMAEVQELCDSIVVMSCGRVIEAGRTIEMNFKQVGRIR